MQRLLINGALLEIESNETLVETVTYMDGFLLGVVVQRDPRFRASLLRVWPRTFEAPADLPEIWARFGVDGATVGSVAEGLRLIQERVDALEDQVAAHYRFRKSTRTSWPV